MHMCMSCTCACNFSIKPLSTLIVYECENQNILSTFLVYEYKTIALLDVSTIYEYDMYVNFFEYEGCLITPFK